MVELVFTPAYTPWRTVNSTQPTEVWRALAKAFDLGNIVTSFELTGRDLGVLRELYKEHRDT